MVALLEILLFFIGFGVFGLLILGIVRHVLPPSDSSKSNKSSTFSDEDITDPCYSFLPQNIFHDDFFHDDF